MENNADFSTQYQVVCEFDDRKTIKEILLEYLLSADAAACPGPSPTDAPLR